jgi:hypothetical protein
MAIRGYFSQNSLGGVQLHRAMIATEEDRVAKNKSNSRTPEMKGRCSCGAIEYRITSSPLIVHACHCRDCQRITGSAFVINIWIEGKYVELIAGEPQSFRLKGGTGKAHEVFFCAECGTYLWSRYHGAPGNFLFVRSGTLEHPEKIAPDVHIFTRSKVPWLELPKGAKSYATFYRFEDVWSPESLQRMKDARAAAR